jgi:hypothetical protein
MVILSFHIQSNDRWKLSFVTFWHYCNITDFASLQGVNEKEVTALAVMPVRICMNAQVRALLRQMRGRPRLDDVLRRETALPGIRVTNRHTQYQGVQSKQHQRLLRRRIRLRQPERCSRPKRVLAS